MTARCLTSSRAVWGISTRWWCMKRPRPSSTCPTAPPESSPLRCLVGFWFFPPDIFVCVCEREIYWLIYISVTFPSQCSSSSAVHRKQRYVTLPWGPSIKWVCFRFWSFLALMWWWWSVLMTSSSWFQIILFSIISIERCSSSQGTVDFYLLVNHSMYCLLNQKMLKHQQLFTVQIIHEVKHLK